MQESILLVLKSYTHVHHEVNYSNFSASNKRKQFEHQFDKFSAFEQHEAVRKQDIDE